MRERKLFIEPHFQTRFVLRLAAWVAFSTLLTGFVTWSVLAYQDRLTEGDLVYISPEGGPAPHLLTRANLVIPSVLLSLVLNLTLIVLFSLFYSRRLAGPILKLRLAIQQLTRGESVSGPFRLRKSDEFHLLAADFDELLQKRRGAP